MGTIGRTVPQQPLDANRATYPTTKTSHVALPKEYLHIQMPNDKLALNASAAFRDIRYSPNRLAVHALSASITPNQAVQ